MLVLSRKKNETIHVNGNEVVFTIVEIRGDKVRVGVEADKGISIHRGEIQEAIDAAERPPVAEVACDVETKQ